MKTSPSSGGSHESVSIERYGEHSAVFRWTVSGLARLQPRSFLSSPCFDVGGYNFHLVIYPKGDSPGYFSFYIVAAGDNKSSSSKWDCFAGYWLSIHHQLDETKSIHCYDRYRFSPQSNRYGWPDFTPSSSSILDPLSGFLLPGSSDSLLLSADIDVLHESSASAEGKFTWKVHNFSLFKEMPINHMIVSPGFSVSGDCSVQIIVYQSVTGGVDCLSMDLGCRSTTTDVSAAAAAAPSPTCWGFFRLSVLNQIRGLPHVHHEHYGRITADNNDRDDICPGWPDFMPLSDFLAPEGGFLAGDTAVFTISFNVMKESAVLCNNPPGLSRSRSRVYDRKSDDGCSGKFTWRIENFTRIKDILKKKKFTGVCIKSPCFQICNTDYRLVVYPRGMGHSEPPTFLSLMLEALDSCNATSDWSPFVNLRLTLVNQKTEGKSVAKESQNRYSKDTKNCGWFEFITLTSLFDQDSGFVVQGTAVLSAEVLMLKESFTVQEHGDPRLRPDDPIRPRSFTWKVENFLSFKKIMETQKISSNFFQAGCCKLRIGVQVSSDMICVYLESDQPSRTDPSKNFWVQYRMAVVNRKYLAKTLWKESSVCTNTWNDSVRQFMKVSDMLDSNAGFLKGNTVIFICEIIDCSPWFEFSDLEVMASDDDPDALLIDPVEQAEPRESEGIVGESGDDEDTFRDLLSSAGLHLVYEDNSSHPQVTVRKKLSMDSGAVARFLTGLRVYLDDPAKVKRFLLPTKLSDNNEGKKDARMSDKSSSSLMNLLMDVESLQQDIIDLLLDIMVECCQPSERRTGCDCSDANSKSPPEVQTSDVGLKDNSEQPTFPPGILTGDHHVKDTCVRAAKTKWQEQSEELLGLIINSLGVLDNDIPQGCTQPKRRPRSVQKVSLVLDKAPKHLQHAFIVLVPKLVDHSEHPLAACALLDWLQKPGTDPSLQLQVFSVLCQLEFQNEVGKHVVLKVVELTQLDRGNLLHQLCAMKEENNCAQRERQIELSNVASKNETLTQSLHKLEAIASNLRAELKAATDHFTREKKDLSEQILKVNNQLEWLRSEKVEILAKHLAGQRVLEDHLHDAEIKLALLKSQKLDELKGVVEEKNALAERLMKAEGAQKMLDKELKCYATEAVCHEEVRKSLVEELWMLRQTVRHIEVEKQEKEEKIARCEECLVQMQEKWEISQRFANSVLIDAENLCSQLIKLSGSGLENLPDEELEKLLDIHKLGLRQIHVVQQQRKGGRNFHGFNTSHWNPTASPMAAGLPPSDSVGTIPRGGTSSTWFNPN